MNFFHKLLDIFFGHIDTIVTLSKEELAKQAMQKRENIRTLAFHIGYAHFYSEKWEYPSLYAEEKERQRRGQIEAAAIWRRRQELQILALTAFVDSFMEGWQAAQELNL